LRCRRYYYSKGVMKRVVDKGRLVYQFLDNAENWHNYTGQQRSVFDYTRQSRRT